MTAAFLGLTTDGFAARALARMAALYPDRALPDAVHGPTSYDESANTVDSTLTFTRVPGPSATNDGATDFVVWSIDIAGPQNDHDGAESLAMWLDGAIQSTDSELVDGVWLSAVHRAGGPPSVLYVDDGDRWHLTGAYVATVQSATTQLAGG